MLIVKIAWRNVFRQKRRTILTVLTMFGGFTLSAISIGWADGTYNRIIDMFTRNRLGHIQVHAVDYLDKPSLYRKIDNIEAVGRLIGQVEGVDAWTPRLYSAGLVSVGENTAGVRIIGVDPDRESRATRFEKKVIEGRGFSVTPSHEAILGKGVAATLKASVDDEIVVVSQGADGSIANDLYTVIGIVKSGDAIMDQSSFFLHLKDAQELLVLEGAVHEIAIIATDLDQVRYLSGKIKQELNDPNLVVSPWQEFARSFYVAMRTDKEGAWIMLFIVILIVAIGVLNTVLMTVLERTREYGVLRSVGTQPLQVFRLVLYEIGFMGIAGIVIGAGLSLFINHLLSNHGIAMPHAFTYGGIEFTHYYSEVNAHSIYIPALTVMLSAMIVSVFPAIKAARVAPAKALRTH
jgi:ABC-type lipoprotein release transport system permease subunit